MQQKAVEKHRRKNIPKVIIGEFDGPGLAYKSFLNGISFEILKTAQKTIDILCIVRVTLEKGRLLLTLYIEKNIVKATNVNAYILELQCFLYEYR